MLEICCLREWPDKTLKIGLFGGTFNPIHHGHLINAQIVLEELSLDKILFIPSKMPVHKELEGLAVAEDRFNMIKAAVDDNPFFEVSRIEIDRKDDSYFIITIRQLLKEYPNDEIFVIIGSDAFIELHKWKDYREILNTVSIILLQRPGVKKIKKAGTKIARDINIINNPLIEISSSGIRRNIKYEKSIKYLVPAGVEEYIMKKGLYKI